MLTDPDLPSGSDRIHQALRRFDPAGAYDAVVNIQGDLPTIEPAPIRAALELLDDPAVDIGTLGRRDQPTGASAPIRTSSRRSSRSPPAAGTAARSISPAPPRRPARGRFVTISASTPTPAALEQFVALPPGLLERRERLEQLRALEAGMRIDVALVDTVPLGVDTPADLDRARRKNAPGGLRNMKHLPVHGGNMPTT